MIQTYSPEEVVMTFGGYIVRGWDTITIKRDKPSFRQINGIRGKNTRVRVGNTGAEISVEVPQTSPLNSVFEEILKIDEQYGTGRLVIMIKDKLGTDILTTPDAYIEGKADLVFDTEISSRQWVIRCLSTDTAQGVGWGARSFAESVLERILR